MEPPSFVAGVVLAGGRSSRMGRDDKCLAPLAGKPVLAHVIERLRPQLSALAINANQEPARFAGFGLPVIADRIGGRAGPLAGLHAALAWAKHCGSGASHVVTVACDTPFLPDDLVERFLAALRETGRACCVARSAEGVHPVIGLWPIALASELDAALKQGLRKASAWAEQQGAVEVFFPPMQISGRAIDPFFNINWPEELAEANALLDQAKASRVDAEDL
jgi:molybdopterin-guanine dinucleotide biosynthesis protein A